MYSSFQSRNEGLYPLQPQRRYDDVGPLRLTGIDTCIALFNKIARRNRRQPYSTGDPAPVISFWEDEEEVGPGGGDVDGGDAPPWYPMHPDAERSQGPPSVFPDSYARSYASTTMEDAGYEASEDDAVLGVVGAPMGPPRPAPVPGRIDVTMSERPRQGTRRRAERRSAMDIRQRAAMDDAEHMVEAERQINAAVNMDNGAPPSVPGRDSAAEEARRLAEAAAVNAQRAASNAANQEEVQRFVGEDYPEFQPFEPTPAPTPAPGPVFEDAFEDPFAPDLPPPTPPVPFVWDPPPVKPGEGNGGDDSAGPSTPTMRDRRRQGKRKHVSEPIDVKARKKGKPKEAVERKRKRSDAGPSGSVSTKLRRLHFERSRMRKQGASDVRRVVLPKISMS